MTEHVLYRAPFHGSLNKMTYISLGDQFNGLLPNVIDLLITDFLEDIPRNI